MNKFKSIGIRRAFVSDVEHMHKVRMSVKENVLSSPDLVKETDYTDFLTQRGRGWVAEVEGEIIGFSVVDLKEENVWALFVDPDHEGKGAGSMLHDTMMEWYWDQGKNWIWLSTEPGTRAEMFYRLKGWKDMGLLSNGERKFEMDQIGDRTGLS